MASLDGNNIFGAAVQVQQIAHPNAQQINTFFGVTGTQALFGGGRGRMFVVRGILLGASLAALNQAESTFQSLADGVARTLIDQRGRTWPNVIFKGEFVPDPRGPFATAGGWALQYRAVFHGLS